MGSTGLDLDHPPPWLFEEERAFLPVFPTSLLSHAQPELRQKEAEPPPKQKKVQCSPKSCQSHKNGSIPLSKGDDSKIRTFALNNPLCVPCKHHPHRRALSAGKHGCKGSCFECFGYGKEMQKPFQGGTFTRCSATKPSNAEFPNSSLGYRNVCPHATSGNQPSHCVAIRLSYPYLGQATRELQLAGGKEN